MKKKSSKVKPAYLLGLDLGATSLGWAILENPEDGPSRIVRFGVRIFEAGVEGNIEQGKDSSRATERRTARLVRRQLFRRAVRIRKVFTQLQQLDLLPKSNSTESEARHELICELDKKLLQNPPGGISTADPHLLPYQLRAQAASKPFRSTDRYALGRALLHLAQRRGFLSNRKQEGKKDEDLGIVKKSIGELAEKLEGRTLGQYFATLDPLEQRIRQRWTSRQMYLDEFEKMWKLQAPVFGLSEKERKDLHKAIFFQRPLKSQKGLVGKCELEREKQRASWALPIAQQFRILQTVNHLRIQFPDGEHRELTLDEKRKLHAALDGVSELSFTEARKILGFKTKGTKFSLEESSKQKIPGNRTRAKLEPIFGERWFEMDDPERDRLVLEILHFQKPDALARRAMEAWGLTQEKADKLKELQLEQDYARHSALAMHKLVEKMKDGGPYSTARLEVYPHVFESNDPLEQLPPILEAKPDLRNPAVCRALTEVRKVVNAIIRKYGKPEKIRIELARELKKSRKEREEATKRISQQTKRREEAVKKIVHFMPGFEPRRGYDSAVEKVLLANECNWTCPFTDEPIAMSTLIGPNPQFDVAHIYPRKYLDDSFLNKTLCHHEVNRHRMLDRTPYEAFGNLTEKSGRVLPWNEILKRVRAFDGTAAKIKLERFECQEVPDDFVNSQLNDTRHNSVAAAEFLGLLYGGRWDSEGTLRVECITGGITALLRNCWGLHKDRSDHRHHALDAVVLALTSPKSVAELQKLAEMASAQGRRITKVSGFPRPELLDDLDQKMQEINVSFRVNHRLGGALHAGTNYSPPKLSADGKSTETHVQPCFTVSRPKTSMRTM